MAEYKLSASLSGHDNDVRSVLFPTSQIVLSASRDNTTRIWKLVSTSPPVYDATIASHSGHWLNALTYLPPKEQYPDGLVIAGGKDLIVEVRQPSRTADDNAEALLLGHSNTICALDVDPAGSFIVSGAWDNEARIWPIGKWECEAVLGGHEGSVWAVIAYDSQTIITGCADQKIRIFKRTGKLMREFHASKHPIRALCRVPKNHPSGADFAAADNDGIIRLWSLSGKQMGDLIGHESFIYALASSPTGEIVSSGEDRTVRIWKGTECIQTITHPAISVWSVAVCAETGDVVSGASDKVVRVFSRSPERLASKETVAQFEESVKASAIPQQTMGEINKEKLPGPEFLTTKLGTKDGQVQMILEANGSVTAHTWSSATGQWTNVGTVVDSVGSSGPKQAYNGKEYDFVFDVDMEDGKPPLKLPYNLSQNPYEAASKFITDNEAPITYLDQVANFIIQNTQGKTIGQTQPGPSGPDPWGSEDRYRPGDGPSSSPAVAVPPKVLPQKTYLNITVARVPAIGKKVKELNDALISSGHKDKSLNPTELSVLGTLCSKLEATSASSVTPPELELAIKLATVWPYKDRLPGIDLLRLLAVASATASFAHPRGGNVVGILEAAVTEETPAAENHIMMALRAFANLFETAQGRVLAGQEFSKIQALISSSVASSSNRNLLVAATTVYINYAVLFTTDKDAVNFEHVINMLDTLGKILTTQSDSESIYRAMVAVGTLVGLDEEAKSAAKDVYAMDGAVKTAMGKASDPRIKNVGKEITGLLK